MKTHSRCKTARIFLIFWCLFIGIGAVGGAVTMFIDPMGLRSGMGGLLPGLHKLPFADILFRDLIFSGIALLCVNGLPNLAAAGLLIFASKKKAGIVCGTVLGLTLMAWITIQFVIYPSNILSNAYFCFGVLQATTGIAAWIFYDQEHFSVDAADYPDIASDHKRLVVYFSRMGYTKKLALEEANRTGADIYEVKATERTDGTPGFWWCGRYGMHRWKMPVEEVAIDLSAYDRVTICTPIWVFNLSAPMRAFCASAKGKIREADYILTHFQRFEYKNAVREMNCLLGITAVSAQSVCFRRGRILSRKSIRKF